MKLHRQAHVVYKAQYHIVWVTRFRRKILVPGVAQYFKMQLREVREYYPDWYIEEVGTDKDHVHLYMVIPPKYPVSFVVETLKKNTSRSMWAHFPFLHKVYWDEGGIWARGYFVSTVGVNEAVIRRYVAMQGNEDSGQALLDL